MPPATATPSDFDARTLLDCVDDVIIVVDDDFRFTYANSAARDFLGQSLVATEDHAGTEPLDVVHPDDVQHVAERFAEIVADDERPAGRCDSACAKATAGVRSRRS